MNPDLLAQLLGRLVPTAADQTAVARPRKDPRRELDSWQGLPPSEMRSVRPDALAPLAPKPVKFPEPPTMRAASAQTLPQPSKDPVLTQMAKGTDDFAGDTPLGFVNEQLNPMRLGGMANEGAHRIAQSMGAGKLGDAALDAGMLAAGALPLVPDGMGGSLGKKLREVFAGAKPVAADPRLASRFETTLASDVPSLGAPKGIEAWHGTHVRGIPEFKDEFIGSGEGAQVFTSGHYSTETKELGKRYRENLLRQHKVPRLMRVNDEPFAHIPQELYRDLTYHASGYNKPGVVSLDDVPWSAPHVRERAKESLEARAGKMKVMLQDGLLRFDGAGMSNVIPLDNRLREELVRQRDLSQELARAFAGKDRVSFDPSGGLYRLDLDVDPERMIQWDKSYRFQPKPVRRALDNVLPDAHAALERRKQDLVHGDYDLLRKLWTKETDLPDLPDEYSMSELQQDAIDSLSLDQRSLVPGGRGGYNSPAKDRTWAAGNRDRLPMIGDNALSTARSALEWEDDLGQWRDGLTDRLKKEGVHGVKYLDGFSREARKGTYNYVTYEPWRMRILQMLGLGGIAGGLGSTVGQEQPEP